jgi:hypothetical protein
MRWVYIQTVDERRTDGGFIDIVASREKLFALALNHVLDLLSQVSDTAEKTNALASEVENSVYSLSRWKSQRLTGVQTA